MEYALSELFTLQMGKTPSRDNSSYWKKSENNWISIADLTNSGKYISNTKETLSDSAVAESGIKKIPANTVIMSFKLSLGKVAITEKEMYSNEAIMAFIDKGVEKISPEYLYYLLRAKDWSKGTNKAVMGATLNKATLSTIKIQLHEYDNQLEIVNMLNRVSSSIDFRKQQLTKLDELVKARFVEMFGDPIQNEKCWEIKSLFDLGYCKNGMNFHKGDHGVEIHCLGVGDFKDRSTIYDVKNLPYVALNESPDSDYLLQDGDIVFVRSNGNKELVGRCLAIYPENVPVTYSGFCIRYRLTSEKASVPYILRVLKADSVRKKMAGRGANIQNLNQQTLSQLAIPLPPLSLQNQFADFVAEVDKSKLFVELFAQSTCILAENRSK
ncbi:restriction endonuclease subunit S [Faecalibacterium sp.]|uniref:restriction endonuclease subunit S n=1 Tax=Faecalibacterium sp. TaxID=1971605 RepID=UPI00399B4C95